VNVRQLLRSPPVKTQYGPTLPQLLAPRIDGLPRIVARILAVAAVVALALIVALALRLREPVYSFHGPPASLRFSTKYSRTLTREPTPPGGPLLLSLRQDSSVGLAASFQITTIHLPAYNGEISGLLPVVAAGLIDHLQASDQTFVLWSQGRTRINLIPGYTFTFQRMVSGRPYWGRYVLLTPDISGDREGLELSMLTDPALLSAAKPPISPDSVATVGVLFDPLERLRFG
jgi:hypothetical protein